jgi:transcriptional regulator with XRE-family HTH domain
MNDSLGRRIRELREAKDLSLRVLAKKIGVSAAFLSDVELERRYPSEDKLVLLAAELGAPLEELRRFDTRVPVKALQEASRRNPAVGAALRSILKSGISFDELSELVQKKQRDLEGEEK